MIFPLLTLTKSCVPLCKRFAMKLTITPKSSHLIFPLLAKCPNMNATTRPDKSFAMRIKPMGYK